MVGIELLNNKGMKFIGKKESLALADKTLIVIGIARGGTSLIAGSLEHLGIFTGELSCAPVFEDVKLATAFENNDIEQAKQVIEAYNQQHNVWSFKRPASIDYLETLNTLCRNPIYLFVFKDIFAISNRNSISVKQDVVSGLKKAHDDYAKVVDFIANNDLNAFLFSYEKVMMDKEFFIDTLVSVIGKERVTEEQKKAALEFIEPNPKAYLDATRMTKSKGTVDVATATKVSGWAMLIHSPDSVDVELYVNGEYRMRAKADILRPDLLEKGLHKTGHTGYMFDLTNTPLNVNDKVDVKVQGDITFLTNNHGTVK